MSKGKKYSFSARVVLTVFCCFLFFQVSRSLNPREIPFCHPCSTTLHFPRFEKLTDGRRCESREVSEGPPTVGGANRQLTEFNKRNCHTEKFAGICNSIVRYVGKNPSFHAISLSNPIPAFPHAHLPSVPFLFYPSAAAGQSGWAFFS